MSIGIPAKYELIGNPSISHLFEFFLIPGKKSNTIAKPVVHAEPAPQPIVNERSSSNRPIRSPIIVAVVPIGPVIPVITVALGTISDSGKFDVFLPTMNEDPYADSILVGVFPLPDDNPLAGAGTDLLVAAKFLEAFCELSQYQIGEAFLS